MNSYIKFFFFVTVACGFISFHLIKRLIKKNFYVEVFFFYSSKYSMRWLDDIIKKKIYFYYDFKLKVYNKRSAPKNSELFKLPASNKKIIKELKWKPKFSRIAGFKRDIQETINWIKNDGNLKIVQL